MAEVEQLRAQNREQRDPQIERRLVRLRHEAFEQLPRESEPTPAPSTQVEAGTTAQGLPVIQRDRLTAEALSAAITTHGCAHVPGLITADRARHLASGIDQVFAAYDAQANGSDSGEEGWYEPFKPLPGWKLGGGRKWNRDGGAIWAADSPRLMFELLDAFEEAGVADLITRYLGERPALSMNKSVLRRVAPDAGGGADWHQDGAFLGEGIRSLNVWLALSHCGDDAPGMDVVPRRFDGIVETGTEGANFDWSVSPAMVETVAGDAGVTRPVFEPGDALLFDHLFLHRTASEPHMTRDRYATETWFFAPSAYPSGQVPLVL